MEPIVLGLLAAGTAMIAVTKLSKDKKSASEPAPLGLPDNLAAKELEKDKAYTIKFVTRSDNFKSLIEKQFGAGTPTASTAANIIKSTFQQLGWNVMSEPVLGPNEAANWDAGKPAVWILTGRWTLSDKYMGTDPARPLPEWWGNAGFYKLPIA